MVMDTAPETKIRAIERLGATIVRAHLRRMLADGRIPRVATGCAATSSIRSTTTASSPATRRSALEILEDLPDVDAIVAPLGGGGLLVGHRRGRGAR